MTTKRIDLIKFMTKLIGKEYIIEDEEKGIVCFDTGWFHTSVLETKLNALINDKKAKKTSK